MLSPLMLRAPNSDRVSQASLARDVFRVIREPHSLAIYAVALFAAVKGRSPHGDSATEIGVQ